MRRAFTWTSIAILTLAGAAVLALWVRGTSGSDAVWYDWHGYGGSLLSFRGQLAVGGGWRSNHAPADRLVIEYHWFSTSTGDQPLPMPYPGVRRFTLAGFGLSLPTSAADPPGWWCLVIPCWFLVPLTLGSAVLLCRREWRRSRRRQEGLCRRCGYDLRASPERCPECGFKSTVPVVSTRPASLPS